MVISPASSATEQALVAPEVEQFVRFKMFGRSLAEGVKLASHLHGGGHMTVLDFAGDALYLRAVDAYDSLCLRVAIGTDAPPDARPFRVTVGAKSLSNVAAVMPDELITVTMVPATARVEFEWPRNRISLRCDTTLPRPGFFRVDALEDVLARATLSSADFSRLTRLAGFVLTDGTRPALGGINLEISSDGFAGIAATDGFGLGEDTLNSRFDVLGDQIAAGGFSAILSPQALPFFLPVTKAGGVVEMDVRRDGVAFRAQGIAAFSAHVSGDFPDFHSLIPKGEGNLILTVDPADLLSAFRISKVAGESDFVNMAIPSSALSGSGETELLLCSVGGENLSVFRVPARYEARGVFAPDTRPPVMIEGVTCHDLHFKPKLLSRALRDEKQITLGLEGLMGAVKARDSSDSPGYLTVFMPAFPPGPRR